MDGTGERYAKWNKLGGKGQIPYDLTYKWNLTNKTNKQAKYNQRHWNKKQTDSNQRGGWKGITGEWRGGVKSKNMYKGPMDKDNWGLGRIKCGRQWETGENNEIKMGTIVIEQQYIYFNKKVSPPKLK